MEKAENRNIEEENVENITVKKANVERKREIEAKRRKEKEQ